MEMTVCLDTSAYIAMFRGRKAVARFLAKCETIVVPAAVVAELFEGAFATPDSDEDQITLERFLSQSNVRFREADLSVAARYGFIARQLRLKGTPLPVNDVWIAATALEEGAFAIVSYDHHFDAFSMIQRIAP